MAVKPHYLPSVPRIFEKIYTLVTSSGDPEKIRGATQLGLKVRALRSGRPAGPRGAAGGLRQGRRGAVRRTSATCSAAGCARRRAARRRSRREILEFFYACGVPVLEGYGMTETATASTASTRRQLQVRHRRAARCRGAEIRIAEDGEILVKGPHIFGGYYKMEDKSFGAIEDGWLHTGDLGSIDEDGFLVDHRPQEGHHHHRGRQEPDAREPRERPQAVALDLAGRDVRRPPALPGGADHARSRGDRGCGRRSRACPRTRRRSPTSRRCAS